MINNELKIYPPKVTVLMCCYNGAEWLDKSIVSILNQTFTNFEFIIIDDGSTDATWEIIKSYKKVDNRILSIRKKNTGLTDSLNFGMSVASGTWIARIDQDDVSSHDRLLDQINYTLRYPKINLLGGCFNEVDIHSHIVKRHKYPSCNKKLTLRLERMKSFFPHSSAFFRLETANIIGGYNHRFSFANDLRLWLEFTFHGQIGSIPKLLVDIRKHPNQISSIENAYFQHRDAIAAVTCYFIKKKGFKDPGIDYDDDEWLNFLAWLEFKLDQDKEIQYEIMRREFRGIFLNKDISYIKKLRYIKGLIFQNFDLIRFIHEKVFGKRLPEIMADEWISLKKIGIKKNA
jgi:glycosyltransferase involved in cell wall biosynthesis